MDLIDSHCHLDFNVFDDDRSTVLANCQQLGINDIIIPGVTANTWDRLLTVCQQSTMLHPALGMHPMFMDQHQAEYIDQLNAYVSEHKPVAIGEIGLDFYIADHDKQSQIELFEQQLAIAHQHNLPVILHVRKAHDQTLALLKKHQITAGIVHAFSGSEQQANNYIKQGFLLGIGGVITHERATRLRKLFSSLPLSNIVLETDAPDMPLANMPDIRNTPENIPRIVATLAELRAESQEQIADISSQNVRQIFLQQKNA
ncbi:DNAase [Methylophaga sp. 42_25_T18]|nr:DNAase [Methylophaga sp. 42_25_T18]OUR88734.1 DNAase [Methylophaga sp. 42_8_T64]